MNGNKNRKSKYSYINSYKKDAEGKYVFCGKYYKFSSSLYTRKRLYTLISICLFSCVSLSVISGCIDTEGSTGCFYVIIPFILEAAGIFYTVWKIIELILGGEPLKDYVYSSTVKQIPLGALLFSIFSGAGLVSELVYILLNGTGKTPALAFLYIGIKALSVLLGLSARKLSLKLEFTETV